jgi:hypothetical protein
MLGSEQENLTELLRRQQQEAALYERRLQQGFGKPIQSYPVRDGRAVVIGRSLMIGKWPTFGDDDTAPDEGDIAVTGVMLIDHAQPAGTADLQRLAGTAAGAAGTPLA